MMNDYNDELVQQQQNAADLQQAMSNYKKSPKDRLTKTYITDHIKKITELWEKFLRLDRKLHNVLPEGHTYYEKDYYQLLGAKYSDIQELMEGQLKALRQIEEQSITNDPKASGSMRRYTKRDHQRKLIENIQSLIQQALESTIQNPQFYDIKLKTINQNWKNINILHETLLASSDSYDLDEYFALELRVNDGMYAIQERINMFQGLSESAVGNSEGNKMPKHIRLPTVELPKFDGTYLAWRQFKDLFTELIHRQPIPQCQKMWYLKGSVSGEADQLIKHLSSTAENYDTAWQMLEDRYENKRMLINAILGRLLSQPIINHESSVSIKSLHDTTQECLLSLKNLKIEIQHWDPILLHLLIQKLNRTTHTLWEQYLNDPKDLPNINDFLEFLKQRFQALENIAGRPQKNLETHKFSFGKPNNTYRALSVTTDHQHRCIMCQNDHALYKCHNFLQLTPNQRLSIVQRAKNCVNCLKHGHSSKNCTSRACLKCKKKHNTLLHLESPINKGTAADTPKGSDEAVTQGTNRSAASSPPVSLTTTHISQPGKRAILSTIALTIKNKNGESVCCRALLDSGSQLNLISKNCLNKLGFHKLHSVVGIEGIGQNHQSTDGRINLEIKSNVTNFSCRLEAHVLSRIVSTQPTRFIDVNSWNIPTNIKLADPRFNEPGDIDLLIGSGIFFSILSVGQISLGNSLPRLQNSLFGWIIGGEYESKQGDQITCGICTEETDLNTMVERFWELEETGSQKKSLTIAEQRCETFYSSNIRRCSDGRYVVKLPFKGQVGLLGQSHEIALQRFKAVERKLSKNPLLKEQYVAFMREYEKLNRMTKVEISSLPTHHYFLPHHAVLKPDSTTTKLRVVFDASAKTSTNVSLNDILDKGPTIQDDMFVILMRFRLHRYVFTADIEKMYRQIWVDEQDRNMQLILWREDSEQPINYYQLNTVTYGTASAPFLAIRTLREVASNYKTQFPLAARSIENDFYVDDVLSGDDSLSVALETQNQLITAFKFTGFNLRKWCANHPRLLEGIRMQDREVELNLTNGNQFIKMMGLNWQPSTDDFKIKMKPSSNETRYTKRSILSDTAQIFDPLGFIAPVTVTAKIILQKLWLLKLDWDAAIPQDLHQLWFEYKEQIGVLSNVTVPRHIFGHNKVIKPQLHIFTDASEKAYGAVAYMRITQPNNVVIVRLVCAKSRVVPIKQITLPRLELCAAKLGVEMLKKLQEIENFRKYEVFCWTDSTAVLGWINSESSNYHTFIANRISAIHQITSPSHWRHVRTQDNPADLISRGLSPSKIINNQFWFYGPRFLHGSLSCWPLQPPKGICELEVRKPTISINTVQTSTNLLELIDHKNSFRHLQRVIAYIRRLTIPKRDRPATVTLQSNELEASLLTIVKLVQSCSFPSEIADCKITKNVQKSSSISSLTPFVDHDGILRVGGRLEHSTLNYDAKHPMILPYHHIVTKLLAEVTHTENLHAGPQAIMAMMRQRFWPLKLKMLARTVVQNCVKCTRAKPKLMHQLMGNLPPERVQPSRPFIISGVDFFGPLWTHFKIRGKRPLKAYVALFCCFATKAIHMELVSDLTTEAFIGALKRFTARRGHCQKIFCDNATNFVGANNYIRELYDIIHSDTAKSKIQEFSTKKSLEFSFIPPRAPHFGGLWEAGVKSAKRLLLSTLSSTSLTYEEMDTLIIEAEAILNSRPLTPLSDDPDDLQALTPGHFLIGEPLTATIDSQASTNKTKGVARWKLLNHLKSEFWKRWSTEYLSTLQHRYKWKQEVNNVQPGTMVIIKEDNIPASKWPLGRIVKAIPGSDGLVRVVDVRTASNIVRRPIHRLAPLPIEDNQTKEWNYESHKDTDNTELNPPKRSRLTSSSIPLSLVILCILLPLCFGNPVEIQPFSTKPGIYFEKLGLAEIESSEWSLISYIDMQQYWKRFNIIGNYPEALNKSSNQSLRSRAILQLIEGMIEEITLQNQLIQPTKLNRVKRGAVNVVGNIANALFGVLDNTYAENVEKTIETIKLNEDHLVTQIKKQTSFLDTTINIVKRDQTQVHNEIQKMANAITKLQTQQVMAESVAEIAIQAALDILQLERIQESLIEILVLSHQGRISPELISPRQLQIELNKIKINLPSNLRLPASTDDLLNFYKLMKIEGRAMENYIIFKITIPLIENEEFELLKLTSVPWVYNTNFVKVQSQYSHIIINLHRDKYLPLTEADMPICTSINKNVFLCKPHHPFQKGNSTEAVCEVQLLTEGNTNPSCIIVPATLGPHWFQLQNPNIWIYSVNGRNNVNAVCGSVPTPIILENSGVLILRADCSIKQPMITIKGYRKLETTRHEFYIPAVDIEQHSTNLTSIMATSGSSIRQDLEDVQKELSELRVELPDRLRPHDIHHYSIMYVSITIIAAIFWILIWKFKIFKSKIKSIMMASTPPGEGIERHESNTAEEPVITISI